MDTLRILIVAAYASVRAGLQVMLEAIDGIAIVGETANSADLDRLLSELSPTVVIYDDSPDDRSRVIKVLTSTGIGLVMLGEDRAGYQDLAASHLSAWAYLLREADGAEIAAAAQAVAMGLIVLDRSLTSTLIPNSPTPQTFDKTVIMPGTSLTTREREVLQLMAQGLPNKQIAAKLHVSAHTIKFHVASILSKFDATSRTEAVTVGARRGDVML